MAENQKDLGAAWSSRIRVAAHLTMSWLVSVAVGAVIIVAIDGGAEAAPGFALIGLLVTAPIYLLLLVVALALGPRLDRNLGVFCALATALTPPAATGLVVWLVARPGSLVGWRAVLAEVGPDSFTIAAGAVVAGGLVFYALRRRAVEADDGPS